MHEKNLIAIGGSAGSLQPMLEIVEYLKPQFSIPVLLILHRNPAYTSPLENVVMQRTRKVVKEVEEKEKIKPNHIYICPADYHVLIEKDNSFSLDDSEKVNFCRPSIDVVFRSAADVFKNKLICILLSGANADGAAGLSYAKKEGSITIIQDPGEAKVPFMPAEAIKTVKADHVLNVSGITGFLNSFVI